MLPAITQVPHDPAKTGDVLRAILSTTTGMYTWFSPVFTLGTLIVLFLLYIRGSRYGRLASLLFGAMFLFSAFTQHIAVTADYGLVIVTGNIVMICTAGLMWVKEAARPSNDYSFPRLPTWRYWVVPFAALAFWFPVGPDLAPDFSPLLLIWSAYGVTFCPTAPVVIAIATLIAKVDKNLLAVTSVVGFVIGIFNALGVLLIPGYTLWLLALHMPLIFISFYGLLFPRLIAQRGNAASSAM